jgi:hypothetical protein
VEAASGDHERAGFDFINKPVFLIDAPRPESGKVAPERFGFSDADER